ncbi:hypothetical protein COT98_01435 [Candidatus Falkowbacteria bacterium CG10_big_fil_rev_8_21_14_0_10_39_9]|uniref:Uncharacterized protein n=1 Tax=Candidatus Falkowbacteria bacterium CG10_big_fil_rev_8_21_14_0_10_39_9 TaxID=1974566 RepID=A0A2M6WQF3_9BACT|nr:MAG: hypothetical protein COT98_01435 [Candidatus Falkowbacteria bacterium CG10_big_fil_rev_8_21_14_0_10_39_9]
MEKIAPDKISEFLENSVNFLNSKLNHLGDQANFSLSIINEKENPDKNYHVKVGNLYFRKFGKRYWAKKLDDIVSLGASGTDIIAVLTPTNTGTEYDRLLIAKIIFRVNAKLRGEMDFIREYCGDIVMKEFIIAQNNIDFMGKKHRLCEITSDWDNGIKLIGMSIIDFDKNPDLFIKDRILRHK